MTASAESREKTIFLSFETEGAVKGMMLNQLREARQLTQVNLAEALQINQGAVSMMEKRTDMYVSTQRNYIEAMGGELKITAEFPDGSIQIEQFESAAGA